MKKLISLCLFVIMLISCFTGCATEESVDPSGSELTNTTAPTDSATEEPEATDGTAVGEATPDGSSAPEPTPDLTSEEPFFVVSASPDPLATPTPPLSPTPTPTPTPVPTPTPTLRPAQKSSIVPAELLVTGYTKPLDPKSVKFPANYNMPYYIEVDVTNQCINIFRKNDETGAYDILLNRFVCSGGTSSQPTKTGNFFIKTNEQQKAATGQSLKYVRYYFQKYYSYAYYITRYSNEYMFHSFTFTVNSSKKIVPKNSAYYNMGNTGSAGCLRMLMGHAKWIYENIDGGTYCVVNKNRPRDNQLRSVLKKYVPPLGYDMTPAWNGNRSNYTGLVECDFVKNPQTADKIPITPPPATPTPTPTDILSPSISPSFTPDVSPSVTPGVTPDGSPTVTPDGTPGTTTPLVTPGNTPNITPDTSPEVTPTAPVVTPTPTTVPTAPPTVPPTVPPTAPPTVPPTVKPTVKPTQAPEAPNTDPPGA